MSGGAPYTILRAIASGGMGTVYLARREGALGVSRVVALKRAHADLASDPQGRRRFVREAVAASRVHHANVVPVTDLFERDGELWLVLDWVDGASLAEVARTAPAGKLEPRVAMRVVLDACAGLAAAHDLRSEDGAPDGLLHRDVSPQNILLGRDGVARLADFGLAKSIDATLTATVDRMVEGKLGYLAPELFTGHAFDASCDLYAMAVVAWETLAGRRLFRGKSLRELTLEQRTPLTLSSAVAGVPPALDEVLGRALAFDRGERTRGVGILHEQLEEVARQHVFVATSTEVGRIVASVLESAGPTREAPLRTPTTGPLDPETSPSLDDAPTPIAADEVLREIERPAARTVERVESDAGEGAIAEEATSIDESGERGRRTKRKRTGIAVGVLAVMVLGAVAVFGRERTSGSESVSVSRNESVSGSGNESGSGVASLRREPPERVPYRRVNPPDPPQRQSESTSGSEEGNAGATGSAVVVDMDEEPEASARVISEPVRRARVEGPRATSVPPVPENPYRKNVGSP